MDFSALGLNGAVLLAGFSGGVCYIAVQNGVPTIWGACSALLVATLTANYSSEIMAIYLGHGTRTGFAAFITGLCSTWLCKAVLRKAQKWKPNGSA